MRRATLFVSIWFIASTTVVHGAAFRYGNAVSVSDGAIRVRYRTLEQSAYFHCDLGALNCIPLGSVPPQIIPDSLLGKRAISSPLGDFVITREVASEQPIFGVTQRRNTLYQVVNGATNAGTVLPITIEIRRVYFPTAGTRLVIATASELVLYDRVTNAIVNVLSFDFGDRVAFSTISPTGKYFAYYQYGNVTESTRVHTLIDLETGKIHKGTPGEREWDLLGDENRLFQFTPDEKLLVYLDDRDGFPTLYRTDLTKLTGEPARQASQLAGDAGGKLGGTRMILRKYTVADFLLWDNQTVFFVANRDTPLAWNLYRYNFVSGNLEKVANQISYGGVLTKSGKYLLYNRLDAQGSTVLYYDSVSRETAPVPAQIGSTDMFLEPGKVVQSGKSMVVLAYPDNFSRTKIYPVILWLHGGPYRQAATGYHSYQSYGQYDWILENLRRSGFVIAKLDYRGSYSYGRKFADQLRSTVGLRDVSDVISDLALVKKNVNVGSAYLMGNSYGGYLGLRTIVEHSPKFAGVISVNGVTDWAELIRNVPDGLFAAHFNGPPEEGSKSAAMYYQASILGRLDGLTTDDRVMLVHSEHDTSVPYKQSVLLRDALAARGRSDTFISYPGEDHVFAQSTTVEDLCRRVLAFVGASSAGKCELL